MKSLHITACKNGFFVRVEHNIGEAYNIPDVYVFESMGSLLDWVRGNFNDAKKTWTLT